MDFKLGKKNSVSVEGKWISVAISNKVWPGKYVVDKKKSVFVEEF